jgi:hypothetical protein
MKISSSPQNRARLYDLSQDRSSDTVEEIIRKAELHDEVMELIKHSLRVTDNIDLLALVGGMLVTNK